MTLNDIEPPHIGFSLNLSQFVPLPVTQIAFETGGSDVTASCPATRVKRGDQGPAWGSVGRVGTRPCVGSITAEVVVDDGPGSPKSGVAGPDMMV